MEGSDLRMEALFLKSDHSVTGYYELESEKNMKNFIEVAMPSMREKFDAMKMDEAVDFILRGNRIISETIINNLIPEFGVEATCILTKTGPGRYKLVCKNKVTGKLYDYETNFTEFGYVDTMTCDGIIATANYRCHPLHWILLTSVQAVS
jgi:hypothetical protein